MQTLFTDKLSISLFFVSITMCVERVNGGYLPAVDKTTVFVGKKARVLLVKKQVFNMFLMNLLSTQFKHMICLRILNKSKAL